MHCTEFVNADEIAVGLSPFNPESMAIEAGKLMLKRIDTLLHSHVSFAIETTLATRSYRSLVTKSKNLGYRVVLLFFWLPSPEMAVQRVVIRVATGGHNIPTETIYRRYYAGIRNLFEIFVTIVDSWPLYDNSETMKTIVRDNKVIDSVVYNKIKNLCQS